MAGTTSAGLPLIYDTDVIDGASTISALSNRATGHVRTLASVGGATQLYVDPFVAPGSTNKFIIGKVTSADTIDVSSNYAGTQLQKNTTYGKIGLPAGCTALAWGFAQYSSSPSVTYAFGIGYHTNVAATVPVTTDTLELLFGEGTSGMFRTSTVGPFVITNDSSQTRWYSLFGRAATAPTPGKAAFGMMLLNGPNFSH